MTRAYRISGLGVASQIDLPGAIEIAPDSEPAAVTIGLADVPDALENAEDAGPNWQLADDRFLLHVPGLARYLITGGRRIDVKLNPGSTHHDASAFVLGTAFGILLHQRGALVLHGAAVARDGVAVAICGQSGAGKSTLAAALCRAGYEFVTDDLCLVSLDATQTPVVAPDGRRLKLWRESMEKLELGARQGAAVRGGFEKYLIEPPTVAQAAPRLGAIYVLRESRPPLVDGIQPLAAPDAMRVLDLQAYRPGVRARLESKPAILAQGAGMLRHAKVFRLARPRGFEHMDATVAGLGEHWGELVQ